MFLSVAIDTNGAEAVRPWHQRAGASFPTLVDQTASVQARWGFKVIPNVWVIDEAGVLRYQRVGDFHVDRAEDREALLSALALASSSKLPPEVERLMSPRGLDEGAGRVEPGDRGGNLDSWLRAVEQEPANWIIRKQI